MKISRTLLADLFVICTIFPFFSELWAAVDGGILPHTYASILCLICASRSFFLQEISTLHTACRKTNKPYLFFYVYLPLLKRLTKESDSFYEPFKQVFFLANAPKPLSAQSLKSTFLEILYLYFGTQ